jgi:hypothetical protein
MKKTDRDRKNKINGGVFVGLHKRNGRSNEKRRINEPKLKILLLLP